MGRMRGVSRQKICGVLPQKREFCGRKAVDIQEKCEAELSLRGALHHQLSLEEGRRGIGFAKPWRSGT